MLALCVAWVTGAAALVAAWVAGAVTWLAVVVAEAAVVDVGVARAAVAAGEPPNGEETLAPKALAVPSVPISAMQTSRPMIAARRERDRTPRRIALVGPPACS